MYHLQSGIFEDVVFQTICECNEHKALAQMVDRRSSAFPAIFMADRGYESYNTFAHIEQKGINTWFGEENQVQVSVLV